MSSGASAADEEDAVLQHRAGMPAWFSAMEYYALILNRTYTVFVTDRMLCGAKVRGLVSNPYYVPPQMFTQSFWVQT